jgi:SpoVK/Ycf46/Vps4 family AAA+-type ATPase
LVVFATNLEPRQLGDKAFLRRIPNKILVNYSSEEQFKEIFQRATKVPGRMVHVEPSVLDFLVRHITQELHQPLSQCYARDILNQIFWTSNYLRAKPEFTTDLAQWACSNYFMSEDDDKHQDTERND